MRLTSSLSILVLTTAFVLVPAYSQQLEIHTIDVGQGASELFIGPDGTTVLVDGGTSSKGKTELLPYLNDIFPPESRTLDYVIASHDDSDHYGGLNYILNNGYSARVIYHCGFNSGFGRGVPIPVGTIIDLGDGATMTCVLAKGLFIDGAQASVGSGNTSSIGLLIEYGDFIYITAGDLTARLEDQLAEVLVSYVNPPDHPSHPNEPYLDSENGVDVIHPNHHGSRLSSSINYVNLLRCETAIINGGTGYSHPHQDTVDRLLGREFYTCECCSNYGDPTGVTVPGAKVYRTTADPDPANPDCQRASEEDCPTVGDILIRYDGGKSYSIEGTYLDIYYQNADENAPPTSPTPSVTPTPEGFKTPTPTPTAIPTPSVTPTPEGFRTPTPTPSVTPTPTVTPTPSPSPTLPPADLPFYDGFEAGVPSQYWLVSTDADGRVQVSPTYPYAGTYSVLLDASTYGSLYSTAALILTTDLSGYDSSKVSLEFWWRQFNNFDHPGDGVFVSDDYGENWDRILSFNDGPNSYTHELISLSEMRSSYGFDFNDHFQVKFQFYGNFPVVVDGYAIDEVKIWAVTPSPTPTAKPSSTPTPAPTCTLVPTPPPTPAPTCTPVPEPTATPGPGSTPPCLVVDWDDYNGDGTSDFAVYDPGTGRWSIDGITSGVVWGGSEGDIPVPGDYDGDGAAELAYFNRLSGQWNVMKVSGEVVTAGVQWGKWGDIPAPGDYDGDGTADLATWRFSDGYWRIRGVTSCWYGQERGMYPVPGDYDGDGRTDIALVWSGSEGGNNTWYLKDIGIVRWMLDNDIAVPMDYDGDGTTDLAVYRPSKGCWHIRQVGGPVIHTKAWGVPAWGDLPVVGDFDGDGAADLTVLRQRKGKTWWWVSYSSRPVGYSNFPVQTGDIVVSGAPAY